jgi:hypothetical protein
MESPLLDAQHTELPDVWRCGACVEAWEEWGSTQGSNEYFGFFRLAPPPPPAGETATDASAPARASGPTPGPLLSFQPPVRVVHPLVLKTLEALDSQQAAEAFVGEAPIHLDADTEPKYEKLRALVERLLKLESGLKKPQPTETTKRLYLTSDAKDAPDFNFNPLEDLSIGGLVFLGPYDTTRRFLLGTVTAIEDEPANLTIDLMLPTDVPGNGNAEADFPAKWEYGRFKLFEQAVAGVRGKLSLTVPQSAVLWAGQLTGQGRIFAKDHKIVQHILQSLKAWSGDNRQLLALPAEFDDE